MAGDEIPKTINPLSVEAARDGSGRVWFTKAQLAREFGLSEITTAKRLRGVEPAGKSVRGTSLYDLATAVIALQIASRLRRFQKQRLRGSAWRTPKPLVRKPGSALSSMRRKFGGSSSSL